MYTTEKNFAAFLCALTRKSRSISVSFRPHEQAGEAAFALCIKAFFGEFIRPGRTAEVLVADHRETNRLLITNIYDASFSRSERCISDVPCNYGF
jgi:hypothetical protein